MTPHITLDPSAHLHCWNCGTIHPPTGAVPVERWIDECRGFVLMHRHCEKPLEPQLQVELFDELARKEAEPLERTLDVGNGQRMSIGAIMDEIFPMEAGIDGMSDEPDPETDPPNGYADTLLQKPNRWGEGDRLQVSSLLKFIMAARPKEFWPSLAQVELWHQEVRDDVQRWCRIELTHAHPIAGHTLPEREDMPFVLSNIEARAPKKARGARPLSSGKPSSKRKGASA